MEPWVHHICMSFFAWSHTKIKNHTHTHTHTYSRAYCWWPAGHSHVCVCVCVNFARFCSLQVELILLGLTFLCTFLIQQLGWWWWLARLLQENTLLRARWYRNVLCARFSVSFSLFLSQTHAFLSRPSRAHPLLFSLALAYWHARIHLCNIWKECVSIWMSHVQSLCMRPVCMQKETYICKRDLKVTYVCTRMSCESRAKQTNAPCHAHTQASRLSLVQTNETSHVAGKWVTSSHISRTNESCHTHIHRHIDKP